MATITVDRRSTSGGLAGAVASEWTKLWSVRSSWLNIAAAALMTGLLGIQFGFATAYENTHLNAATPEGGRP